MPSSRATRLISDVGRRLDNHFANVVGKIQQFGNCAAAVEAGAGTFQASGALRQIARSPHSSGSRPEARSTSGE